MAAWRRHALPASRSDRRATESPKMMRAATRLFRAATAASTRPWASRTRLKQGRMSLVHARSRSGEGATTVAWRLGWAGAGGLRPDEGGAGRLRGGGGLHHRGWQQLACAYPRAQALVLRGLMRRRATAVSPVHPLGCGDAHLRGFSFRVGDAGGDGGQLGEKTLCA